MDKWDEMLLEVIKDPIFANVKPVQHRASSSDRLVQSFEAILDFVEKNDRLPSSDGSLLEKQLYARLEGIRSDKAKYDKCKPFDRLNILDEFKEKTEDDQIAEILKNPIFQMSPEVASMFDLPDYMVKAEEKARKEAEYIGSRVKCEDFSKYEPLFKAVQADLKAGHRKLIKFRENHLTEGNFFIVSGVLVYLDKIHNTEKNSSYKYDGRTRCIYENGMESDILLQSLAKSLYLDGYSVTANIDTNEDDLRKSMLIADTDVASGYIYVLKSRSDNPEIALVKNLYKIGFTSTTVEDRIANAKNEPTYLYADVSIIATWKVYNIKAVDLENALHNLFRKVQFQLTAGSATPKEWYVVPIGIIEEAVERLIRGERLYYDPALQQLVGE